MTSLLPIQRMQLCILLSIVCCLLFTSLAVFNTRISKNHNKTIHQKLFVSRQQSALAGDIPQSSSSLVLKKEPSPKSVTEEYENVNGALRATKFWKESIEMYFSYKKMQILEIALKSFPLSKCTEYIDTQWNNIHEKNSDKMLAMCLDLGGFYLKFGQFLGTRYDFMPEPFTRKLKTLQDSVPPISGFEVKKVIEKETRKPISQVFEWINLDAPVGSASISQVHEALLVGSGEKVAVKVQYPGAEKVMSADLSNLRKACAYLTKFELNFDLASVVSELQKQLTFEFDFNLEGENMNNIGSGLLPIFGQSVTVPSRVYSTKKLLIMNFIDGVPLSRLGELTLAKRLSHRTKRKICHKLLTKIAHVYGYMVFQLGTFHADPHPGNILVLPGLNIGLLDWGQTKTIDVNTKTKFAQLVKAMSQKNEVEIVDRFYDLGIKLAKPEDRKTAHNIAVSMFDTRNIPGYAANPFDENNGLKTNAVKVLPPDLYFMLRSIQILKGMAYGMGVDFHLSKVWDKYATDFLRSPVVSNVVKN
mmetsp:Transcript_23381/g.30538  ORF Transcript_23381/g.30538 Transcript_23381/m.30538 type:complete len:531 (+) Transcript_23381:91-1683(+)|eukprot:CAMPEP_0117746376 /NCGR_PEP_ID=MMETSP0947-20121206/7911_1 /TAXON_ID=44440 /ORGANISM="Chattonella subsalsa, Strain CCMP2191" /LENGTH=530 /DNA_ID=CAMNT_0005563691 /DNA_START=31 /DNA_END=1623 /DNA_ORIENTATION=+